MNYVIIGGNAAGLSAAMRIRKQDPQAKITVFEAGAVISFGSCGMPYYVAGEFDDIERMTARSSEFFKQKGIDIRLQHQAVKLDSASRTVWISAVEGTPQAVNYDKLLLATGARPRTLNLSDPSLQGVYHLHHKQDAIALRAALPQVQSVAIIGGGFIGLEMVEAFVTQGKQVTLLELQESVLNAQFDREVSELLSQELQQQGVRLELNESITALRRDAAGQLVGVIGKRAEYAAQLLLVAIGVAPNSDFLLDSGIELAKNGAIVIDARCQTSLPHVYAAGDCATVSHILQNMAFIPLATTANKLGRLAGEVMTGSTIPFMGTLGASGLRLFGLEAARIGVTEQQAQALELPYATVWIKDKNHTDYVAGQSDLWIKLIYRTDNRQIIGGQLCGCYGSGAVYRTNVLSVAILKQLTVEELGMLDLVYAPPFSRPWDILNIAGNMAR